MIKGYEDLFGTNGTVPGKYKLLEDDDLVHESFSNGPESKEVSVGRSACQVFHMLTEQRFGGDFYKTLFDLTRSLETTMFVVEYYKRSYERWKKQQVEISRNNAEIKRLSKLFRGLASRVETLTDQERRELNNYSLRIGALTKLNSAMSEARPERKIVVDSIADLKTIFEESVDDKFITKASQAVEMINSEDYKQEMEQDFVDATLLPGEENKEERVKQCFRAMNGFASVELVGLVRNIGATEELVRMFDTDGFSTDNISKRVADDKALIELGSLVSNSSYEMFADQNYARACEIATSELLGSELGGTRNISFHQIWEKVKNESGLPAKKSRKQLNLESSQVNAMIDKVSRAAVDAEKN